MKKSALKIAVFVLIHLCIVDLIFYYFEPNVIIHNVVSLAYNIIWLSIALLILFSFYVLKNE